MTRAGLEGRCFLELKSVLLEVGYIKKWPKFTYLKSKVPHLKFQVMQDRVYYNRTTSTAQLILGDMVRIKNDAYQGKWKVKGQWSETEYVVVRQVADGVPAYEVKDQGAGVPFSEENVAQSTLAECTSFEVESDSPERSVDGADTLGPANRVLFGWVGGVLWPLPSVAPRPTMWRGLGAGDGVWNQSDKEVH